MKYNLSRKADDRGRITLGGEYANQDVEVLIERNFAIEDYPTIRAVHFLSHDDQVKAQLYAGAGCPQAEALFGIHWLDGPIWEKMYFENHERQSALSDFNAMNKTAEGGLVSSYYGARKSDLDEPDPFELNSHLKIGVCPPESSVRAIPFPKNNEGDVGFLKLLPMVNSVEVSRQEFPELFEDNVKGRSVYESADKERLIRTAYRES